MSRWSLNYLILKKANKFKSHLIRDISLLLGEYVVVSQLMIFPLELLGSAEKPMAARPSNSKGKIMSWDKFQIIGGKYKCLLLNVCQWQILRFLWWVLTELSCLVCKHWRIQFSLVTWNLKKWRHNSNMKYLIISIVPTPTGNKSIL